MKKLIPVLLSLSFLLATSACGGTKPPADEQKPLETAVPSPIVQSTAPATEESLISVMEPAQSALETTSVSVQADESSSIQGGYDKVDVDLTLLSSTMVYAEVYAMVTETDQYIGKTVKMKGLFATQEYRGNRLYACIVRDATACCAQGLEFELAGSHTYPEEYPEPGEEITVVGTVNTYIEENDGVEYTYLVLKNARFV